MKRIVKHLLMPLMAAALILSGCCTKSELEEVKQEVSSLTERVASIENTQLKALESQIASIQKEITQLQNADKVQAEDVSALEGKMSVISDDLAQLKESVSSLDGTTEELSGKIAGINAKLSELETQITSILASINELKARVSGGDVTLSYIPKYAYGNELVQYTRDTLKISGTVTLNFTVLPSSAAETIVKDWKSSLSTIAYPLTRADGGESVELAVSDASAKDGVLSVTIDCSKLGKDFILNNTGAALALKVSCGDIQIVSDYIKLSPAMEEKAFIKYLLNNFDTDGDGQVEISEVNKATELNISNMGITSLDGVLEQMPALTTLGCSNNELTSIDLSKNESLTGVNLRGNANLTKVVCKSLDWILANDISTDATALFYKSDGAQITWDTSLTTEIDGKTWKQFNVGTWLGNKYGDKYNFYVAQSACPTGWRVPTRAELLSLSANYSDWTTYLGMKGYWFSGSQTYSPTAPAIFLPVYSSNSSYGDYWSSTEYSSRDAYRLYFDSGNVCILNYYRSGEMSVRCLKDDGDGGDGAEVETLTVAEFLCKKDTATEYALSGTISDVSKNSAGTYWGLTLTDETGSVSCPFIENWDEFPLKNGDKITIKGKYSYYEKKAQGQLANGTIVEYEAVDTPKGEAKGSGTLADPYNATAANAKCADFGSIASTDDYYVKGKISKIKDLSTSYGYATFYISDNGTTAEEQFYVFRAYYLDGADFTTEDQIMVGDEVVVKGKLINYSGSTPELNQGGQIVSINGDGGEETVAEPTSATKVTIKEFLEKSVNTTDWYELTGTIKSIAKADYGNITIEDESGSVYVYGVVKAWANGENDKSFSSLGLKVTDVVTIWTLRAEFNGLALAGGTPPAIYKSHTEGAGETYPAGTVVLSFPDENQSANKVNDYVSTWTAKIGSNEFSIANFNNFKWDGWTYIKCGRKKDASVASIFTQTPIAVKVTKLQLAADTYDASSMNSLTLNVYSDAAKATKVLSQVASDPKAGTIEFAIDADKQAAGLYYELVFDCKVHSSSKKNGFIQISKVAYLAAE